MQFILSRLSSPFVKTLSSNVFSNVLGAITGVILARLLGPEGKGEISAITTWPTMIAWIISCGLALGNTYHLARNYELKDKLYTNSVLASLVLSVVGFLVLWLALPLMMGNYSAEIVLTTQILSSGLLASILTDYLLGMLQARGYYGWIAGIRLFVFFGNLVVVLLFAFLSVEDSIKVSIGYFVVSNLVGMLTVVIVNHYMKPRFQPDWPLFKKTFVYSIKAHLGDFAGLFNSRLDVWLVIIFLTATQVGWYSVAITISSVALSVTVSLSYILFPRVAELEHEEGREAVLRALSTNMLAQLIICILIALAAPIGVPIVFGQDFTNTVLPAEILLIGILFQSGAVIIISGMRGLGYPLYGTYSEVVSLVATVTFLAVFLPIFGYVGAAIGSALAYIVNFLFCYYLLERRYPGSGKRTVKIMGEQIGQLDQVFKGRLKSIKNKLNPEKS